MCTKKRILIICKNCGVGVEAYPYTASRKNFCSRACNAQYNFKGKERPYMIGNKIWVGKKHTEESKEKNRASHLGKRLSMATEFKKGLTPWNKGINRIDICGEKHHNWKGGITKESFKIRNSLLYKQWRSEVFKRDNYTCQICGGKESVSGTLEVDHIKQFAYFPELRFDINNGRTLCKDCHKKTDTYLSKGRQNKKAA